MIRKHNPGCIISNLLLHGEVICKTIEKPWKNNIPYESCIPTGEYELIPYDSPKHGKTYAFVNHELGVGANKGDSDRFACLLHVANWAHQLERCVAPSLDATDNMVQRSKDAMNYLLPIIHSLEVKKILIEDK
jgi:hypothetical protein